MKAKTNSRRLVYSVATLVVTSGVVAQAASAQVVPAAKAKSAAANQSAAAAETEPAKAGIATIQTGSNNSVYAVEMNVDVRDAQQNASTTRLQGELEVTNAGANRIAVFKPTSAETNDAEGSNSAVLDKETQYLLRIPFVLGPNGSSDVWFSAADSESSRNMKRQMAQQVMRTVEPTTQDAFGVIEKNGYSKSVSGNVMTVREQRTNASYSRLNAPPEVTPEILVDQTTTFDVETGLVTSSSETESATISAGTQTSTTTSNEVQQSATTRTTLTLVRTGIVLPPKVDVAGLDRSTFNPVVDSEVIRKGKLAATVSVADALAEMNDGEVSPADLNRLVASLDARPDEASVLEKQIANATFAPDSATAIASAVAVTDVPGAGGMIAALLQSDQLTQQDRVEMLTAVRAVNFVDPSLDAALKSLGLDNGDSPSALAASAIDLPEDCLVDGCTGGVGNGDGTGTGTGSAPAPITLPFDRTWTQTIGSNTLGGEVGAHINIAAPTLPDGHLGLTGLAEGWAKAKVLGQSADLARGRVSTGIDTSNPQYRRTFSANLKVLGITVFDGAESVPCNWTLNRDLFSGSITFVRANFAYPVGPVVFTGGVSASAHLQIPLRVHLEGCGLPLDAVLEASIAPHAWAQASAWGGVTFLGFIGGGIEVTGTALDTTVKPAVELHYTAVNVPQPKVTGRISVALGFRAFSMQVKAWIRIFFWTKRWTLFQWSTPAYNTFLFNRTFG